MNLNESIFREYDIRGIVKTDFPDSVVESLGKAFGTYILKQNGNTINHTA